GPIGTYERDARERIDHRRVSAIDLVLEDLARCERDVEDRGRGEDAVDGPAHARARAREDARLDRADLRHAIRRDVLVARLRHFEAPREVYPELEAPERSVFLLRHLGVNDAVAGGHPLDRAAGETAVVADRVRVLHRAAEHDRHGFEAAVGMAREAGLVVA